MRRGRWLVLAMVTACVSPVDELSSLNKNGYEDWPTMEATFPWVYTPDSEAPSYASARWETEEWGTWSLSAVQYARKLLYHYFGAPIEVRDHFARAREAIPPLGEGIVISFTGDILWTGGNWSSFADEVSSEMSADLRVGNLETVASDAHEVQNSGLPIRYNASPEILDNLPLDVLQLNNNHTLDMDDAGIAATKRAAEERGYTTTGVDGHATVTVGGRTVALLSYTWGLNRRDVTSTHELFIVPFGHLDQPVDVSRIGADIERAAADHVVVLVHWGFEYEHYPHPQFMQLARQIVAMGADVVAGQGPHVVQPAELCHVNHPEHVPGVGTCSVRSADDVPRTAAIFYSLGNFTNDGDDRIEVETGIVGKVSLAESGVTGMGWAPVVFRHDPARTVPLRNVQDDAEVSAESARLDAHLGSGWRINP